VAVSIQAVSPLFGTEGSAARLRAGVNAANPAVSAAACLRLLATVGMMYFPWFAQRTPAARTDLGA
jgi:hypothetical protein